MNNKPIGKATVISVTEYVRKKDNSKIWMLNLLTDDGIVRAFRPYEEAPKKGQEYALVLRYNAFNFRYDVVIEPIR